MKFRPRKNFNCLNNIYTKKAKIIVTTIEAVSQEIISKEKLTENKRGYIKECLDTYFENHNAKVKLNFDINPNNMS